jgi:uncharacterized protein (TIGR03067 family)
MKDIDKLQGVWNIVSLEMEGQVVPTGALAGARISLRGNRFTTSGMGAEYEGAASFDESKSPREFDLKFETGPEKGNTSLGIYELDGNTWRICLSTRGATRPAKFAAEPGTGFALEVLNRV